MNLSAIKSVHARVGNVCMYTWNANISHTAEVRIYTKYCRNLHEYQGFSANACMYTWNNMNPIRPEYKCMQISAEKPFNGYEDLCQTACTGLYKKCTHVYMECKQIPYSKSTMYANFAEIFIDNTYVCIRLFRKYVYISWNAYESHTTIHKLRVRILCAYSQAAHEDCTRAYTHVSEVDRLPFVSWNAYESHTTKVYMYANFCEKACAYVCKFLQKSLYWIVCGTYCIA